jgi:hypothetical protein
MHLGVTGEHLGAYLMASKQSPAQKETVERVMHEFKHGELKANGGRKVKNPKQAIAIALHEAGSSNAESPKTNRQNLKKTKAKEARGETAKDAVEGKGVKKASAPKKTSGNPAGQQASTRASLYEEAKTKDIPGRSKMSKAQLERALHH